MKYHKNEQNTQEVKMMIKIFTQWEKEGKNKDKILGHINVKNETIQLDTIFNKEYKI